MTLRKEYSRIAKDAGIAYPTIEYERQLQAYSICIMIPNPSQSDHNTGGYIAATVGTYSSVDEAREKIDSDLLKFVRKYPAALDMVTSTYANRIKAQQAFTETYDTVTEDNAGALLTALLKLISTSSTLDLTPSHREAAKQGLQYIRDLKAKLPPEVAQGNYHSRYPDQPKQPIDWQQPQARQHPVYVFEVDCPYCGKSVTLERYSPREPQHCGEDTCEQEHQRLLARERKRRQRQRHQSQ
jgi:hypothetical protein